MKKFIIIMFTLLFITTCFAGCSSNQMLSKPMDETTSANEASETSTAIDWGEWEPVEYPEYEWPKYGIAVKLPTPDWSNNGVIYIGSENRIWIYVGYSTFDIFENYVKQCKDFGFNVNTYMKRSGLVPFFYAENENGYAVEVHYITTEHTLSVDASYDSSDYTKDWLEEDK